MNASTHIIVVDDEPEICDLIETYLIQSGYRVSVAHDGETLRHLMSEVKADLVILDLGLPDEDGLSLTRYLREHCDTGVIILTGKGGIIDRIVGLEIGADDYIAKPFDLRELLARTRSVLRRIRLAKPQTKSTLHTPAYFAGWRLDPSTRQLFSPPGREIPLTTGEFELLAIFVTHPKQVLSRDDLLGIIHNRPAMPFDRGIDVLVSRLRRKIENDPENPVLIKTIRGAGYLFTATVEQKA